MGKMAPNRRPKGNRRHPLPPFPHFHFALIFTFSLAFSAFFFQNGAEGSIQGWRMRRQVNVTSSGQVKGIGNQTDASAANNLWKKEDGTVGANGSSIGIAQGLGNSNLMSSSNAVVGGQKVEGAGISMANGTNTKSGGQTSSNVNGNQMTLQNIASGVATGTGNSQVAASGAGSLMNGNQSSLNSGRNTYGEAGSTGNQMSFAESNVGQTLSWSSILVTLEALSISKGENNSQANFNLQGGSTSNGIKISGLVSGVNDKGGGSTFSEAEGTGTLNNRTASMNSALIGAVNATSGGSKLVGASSLSSNGSSNPGSIDSFGDLILNGTGKSMGGLLSNSSVNPDGSVRGVVGVQGMGNGANKSISVNDGVRVGGDGTSQSAAIGQGNIQGMGNQAANGSSFVLTNYQSGQGANMVVGSQGESKAQNGTPSDLRINNQGNFINASQAITNASSNAMGKVTGDQSAVSGQAIMDLGSKSQSGNSSIVATGGGKGSSSALTDTNLSLAGPGGGAPRNSAVKGSVDANGDQTFVLSSSNVSDRNGLQSLSNYQNATVSGKGSSQAQASNVAVLKRRKRRWAMHHFNMEKLAEIIGGNK